MLVAIDANALLSMVAGHAAFRAIRDGGLEITTTIATLKEVREHLSEMSDLYHVRPGILEGRLEALDVTTYGRKKYRRRLAEAGRLMAWRDPDDVDLLALALTLSVPIWTHDRDFEATGVKTYTTAQLLAKLGIRGR